MCSTTERVHSTSLRVVGGSLEAEGLGDGCLRQESRPQGSTDPREWHMFVERSADGTQFQLPPLERPVLYRRGAIPVDDASTTTPDDRGGSPE